VAIPARVICDAFIPAFLADVYVNATLLCPAGKDMFKGFLLFNTHGAQGLVGVTVFFQDVLYP
jgi:hypothetical protein